MPQHAHALNPSGATQTFGSIALTTSSYSGSLGSALAGTGYSGSLSIQGSLSGNTGNAGKAPPDAFDILPAYYTLCYIMKIS
jgi:hypothetical protein